MSLNFIHSLMSFKLVVACQKHRSKHLNLNCIYRIFYKIAKKSAKRTTDFDITNSERIYRKKDILQLDEISVSYSSVGGI